MSELAVTISERKGLIPRCTGGWKQLKRLCQWVKIKLKPLKLSTVTSLGCSKAQLLHEKPACI